MLTTRRVKLIVYTGCPKNISTNVWERQVASNGVRIYNETSPYVGMYCCSSECESVHPWPMLIGFIEP